MSHHLILEWVGFWHLPVRQHDGISAGPYGSADDAKQHLEAFLEENCVYGDGLGPKDYEGELERLERRYRIVAVDWPMDDPEVHNG